jgi:hypothetical protein
VGDHNMLWSPTQNPEAALFLIIRSDIRLHGLHVLNIRASEEDVSLKWCANP